MYQTIRVKLLNLLLSLSDALDLASPLLAQHQLRTAYIAYEISRRIGLTGDDETNLFIAAVLHDVGALTPEEKLGLHDAEVENVEQHCILSEKLLVSVDMFKIPAKIVKFHHACWIKDTDCEEPSIAKAAQIVHLADTIERSIDRDKFILHQDKEISKYIQSLAGKDFPRDLIDVFLSFSDHEDFWLDLTSERLYSILLNQGPCRGIEIDVSHLLEISEMFRAMIDFRSRFTSTHSCGVATSAATLARLFGYTDIEIELMEVAGNLHDIGKMVIPNSILAKPGKLTPDEFAIMRQHTYYTYVILNTIGGIQHIAEWAAFHHERLDGSGYPFHVDAKNISINSRIMAVADIFTALAEERPYRSSMSRQSILSILEKYCNNNWLDCSIVNLLEQNYDEVVSITKEKQDRARIYYEQEFSLDKQMEYIA